MSKKHQNPGRVIGAFVLIGLGVVFLLGQFNIFPGGTIGTIWPFFIIGPGLIFLYFAATGGPNLASLAIPGSIVTGTGLILLFQSWTDHWESWAYIWTLYPVFLGLGLMYMGRRTGNQSTVKTGRGFVYWGLIGCLVFGTFFEVVAFNDFGLGRFLLPAVLILVGVWMLLRASGGTVKLSRGGSRKPKRALENGDPLFTGAPVVGSRASYSPTASEQLRKEIDEALAGDEEPLDGDDEALDDAPDGDDEE